LTARIDWNILTPISSDLTQGQIPVRMLEIILRKRIMNEFEITCINKPDRFSRHEHITHIGNVAAGWKLTREIAIQKIESKTEAFYTLDRATGRKIYIGVVHEAGKLPFLRTHADEKWNDNLLALQECGGTCETIN
jgi:Protein of unknown function (DUF3892)